jgi:hypothetical protein
VVLPEQLMMQGQQHTAAAACGRLLAVDAVLLAELRAAALAELAGRPLPTARQQLPVDMDSAAPLYWPTEKVRNRHPWWHSLVTKWQLRLSQRAQNLEDIHGSTQADSTC